MYQIVQREQFSETSFLWDVFAPDVARAARAGQFIMLRLDEGGERIPLTIADYDSRRGTITLVIQALGRTTRHMRDHFAQGDWFRDFVGPLGEPTHIDELDHVVLVGGGLGVAPIYPQVRAFAEAGCRVTSILGFRSAEHVFWEERFAPFGDVIVCTDDGSYGEAGLVTVPLKRLLAEDPPQRAVAVGPLPMMKACADVTRAAEVPTVVSLNAIMVDGTGMCGSCRVTVDGQIRFACVDGPDFDAHQVDFGELMSRQRRFKAHEAQANQDYEHVCNLEDTLLVRGKRNYKKLKAVAPKAREMPERDATERSANFLEVNLGYSLDDALSEAERCIQCTRPTCVAGCPVGIDIPGFIRQLIVRDLPGALATLHESNLFPSVCGRVCPQESQCEAQCIVGKKLEPVAIGRLERFVGDHAPPPPPAQPGSAVSGRVAIVGSGPAGLACAADLVRAGAEVTVYEALHVVGGVLQYGIPAFRLPREIISREIEGLRAMGVRFEVNKVIGRTHGIEELRGPMGYDAVFIGTGAGFPSFLGIPGEQAGQVYSANEFLTRVNLMGGDRFPYEDTPVALGERVVVLGAGNTAMDCLRVSRRLGVPHVHCVYRRAREQAPARIEELRHAEEEGVQFHWLRGPVAIETDDDGAVRAIRVQHMELGPPDDSGRRRPVPVPDAFDEIETDTVIYALGTRANPIIARATPDLSTNKWGYLVADGTTQATNLEGVFAGGDIVTGGATVILAMGAGRRAARGIETWLGTRAWPPEVADDVPQETRADACPRCGREVEGETSYICCAHLATVRWRCTSCQKVSEGFAFPYGLCPACSGRLTPEDPPAQQDAHTHRAIQQAFEIELGGIALYLQGADETSDPELRSLFERLGQMEREHVATLAGRYHVAPPTETPGPAMTPTQLAVYADVDKPEDGEGLLKLALRLEERAKEFFEDRARGLEEGSPEWRLYRELMAEEYEHVAMIETELERWRAGRAGLL